jgi:predicted O-methyltransferase YrrM
MIQQVWNTVDAYFSEKLVGQDGVLEAALRESKAAGLPEIGVAPNQGRLLEVLARSLGARRILEIGTLGGYSTIWLGRALPAGGRLITLEYSRRHAEVARANIARAGLAAHIEVRVGAALETLPQLATEGPFDLIFIDADKENTRAYFEHVLRLSRPGTLIVVDNVVRDGAVTDAASTDASVQGIRRFIDFVQGEPRVIATALQTVGVKGYDGLALAYVQ